tara:strand:- start:93 stop:239 length:147 start_codon:yes stop_codon:yes gene_type:complete
MIDSLRTATIGVTGSSLHWVEWVPPLFSALAAFATLIYMIIKIIKERK